MKTSEVLRAARDYLAVGPHRWFKGNMGNGEGGFCASGACGFVCDWHTIGTGSPWGAAVAALNSLTGGSVSSYNDAPSTTYAGILALFDRAIAVVEAAELREVFDVPSFERATRTEVPA